MKILWFKNEKNTKRPLFINIFSALILCIVITVAVLSPVLYLNFENIILSQISSFVGSNLEKASYSTSLMVDSAKLLALQIYNDRDIRSILYNAGMVSTGDALVAFSRLNTYLNTAPYIHSIYIYNRSADIIYCTGTSEFGSKRDNFTDPEAFDLIDDDTKKLHLLPYPRVLKVQSSMSQDLYQNVYSFTFYESHKVKNLNDNVIMINISEELLMNTINTLNSNTQGNTFIINEKGLTMISDKSNSMLSDISLQPYIQKILSSQKSKGAFIENVNGVKSLVTYSQLANASLNWKFVNVIPYGQITKEIDKMRLFSVVFCVILMITGLFVAFFVSKKLYKPINSILETLKSMESEKRNSQGLLKQEFLRSLIRNIAQFKSSTLEQRFLDFGINLNPEDRFNLMLFKIDRYSDFCARYSHSDRELYRFSIMNIASELAGTQFVCECVDMESDHVVLLLNTDIQCENPEQMLKDLAGSIQSAIMKHLEISLSCVIHSLNGFSFENLNTAYNESLNASFYRMFQGHGCILFADFISSQEFPECTYSSTKEKALINSLMLHKEEEVIQHFNDIIKSSVGCTYDSFNHMLLRLNLSISLTIEAIEKNCGSSLDYSYDHFIQELSALETVDEIRKHFYLMFEKITSKLIFHKNQESHKNDHEKIVNSIYGLIHEKYTDPNLSVESLAIELNFSPIYLNRIFKRNTSKSISEYITEVRIEKAKDLLVTTDSTVIEIAETVGFSNTNYFYTVFRKNTGVTTAQYRETHKGEM